MAIPDYQSIMLPLLKLAGDRESLQLREAVGLLAQHFALTDDEIRQPVPSGRQAVFHNRVSWARSYLGQAGLLESPKRGWFRITERGSRVLDQNHPKIDTGFLGQFEEFREFRIRSGTPSLRTDGRKGLRNEVPEDTPKETLERAYVTLREELATEASANCYGVPFLVL